MKFSRYSYQYRMHKFIVKQDEPNEPNEQGLEVVWFVHFAWFVHAFRNAFKPDLVHFVWFVCVVHKKETHPMTLLQRAKFK